MRPASIKPGPVSVALPGNRSTLQNSHQRKKNERHIICTSESPESVSSRNALSTGQQTVINKLFRRLIVFLFVLFIFSFLDRINIGFAGLTMGQDLGLNATMFGLATTLFYATYVIFGIPSNVMLSIVGARRWIATIMVLWGIGIYRHDVRGGTGKACMCCECWWALPKRAFCQEYCSI
ncbi:4-hydroxyphenylacetate permease [Salmonella enterica subsp. enterica serovar Daytona]|uniref:4-hydroxyphenylacetate permease n=1 Tax=Salmonella enterica subsp. enterica serovar Daytona TaxID=1962639 RepID=A0A447JJX9_SALET|nr:4-hydroxyphenylacetate permease [Salmonella enterica subsp. enterica serovar Daytona]